MDLNDLVFKNRNKEYGAYFLRKNYKKNMLMSIFIAIIFCCSVVLIPFFSFQTKIYHDGIPAIIKNISLSSEHLDFPSEESAPEKYSEMMNIKPEIVDDNSSTHKGFENKEESLFEYKESNQSLGILESKPSFQGGDLQKFSSWVVSQIIYPEEAQKNKVQGSFTAMFVVEKDGSVSNVKVESNADRSIEIEIKRVISSSPKWNPGISFGKPVRVRCEIPLIFTIK